MRLRTIESLEVEENTISSAFWALRAPVLLPAAIIGAMAYGTYEFTSYAIMKDWHWQMVATDTLWGTVLTALSAWGGVVITRALVGP